MIEEHSTPNCGINAEEFERFTLYCNASDNQADNLRRAQILGFNAENVRIAPGAIVRIGKRDIGAHSFIGLYSYINGDVTIGENVLIGPHCSVTAGHHTFEAETASFSGRSPAEENPIVIGDGTWLASGCVVTAGVTVGRANLLCANCVLTKDSPDFAIMAGVPAKQIGRIDPQSGAYIWFTK